jgi:hypothetical protein
MLFRFAANGSKEELKDDVHREEGSVPFLMNLFLSETDCFVCLNRTGTVPPNLYVSNHFCTFLTASTNVYHGEAVNY